MLEVWLIVLLLSGMLLSIVPEGICGSADRHFAPHASLNDFLTLDKNLLAPFRPPMKWKSQPGSWNSRGDDNVKRVWALENFSLFRLPSFTLCRADGDLPTCSRARRHKASPRRGWTCSRRAAVINHQADTEDPVSRTLDSPLLFEQWKYEWVPWTQPVYLELSFYWRSGGGLWWRRAGSVVLLISSVPTLSLNSGVEKEVLWDCPPNPVHSQAPCNCLDYLSECTSECVDNKVCTAD